MFIVSIVWVVYICDMVNMFCGLWYIVNYMLSLMINIWGMYICILCCLWGIRIDYLIVMVLFIDGVIVLIIWIVLIIVIIMNFVDSYCVSYIVNSNGNFYVVVIIYWGVFKNMFVRVWCCG